VFAWFAAREPAEAGARAMQAAFAEAGFASEAFVSPINGPAARVLA
jgi:homoserine kinase